MDTTPPSTSAEYRFGRFVLRPRQRRLWEDGAPLPVGNRALDLLLALIEQRHRVVTRDELFERVWPGRVVADDNLKMQVLALRKLLGADAVVTVPRQGYRFGLDVHEGPPAAAAAAATAPLLIGRGDDVAAALRLLQQARLVTVAGSGGIGKTQVALAVLAAAAGAYADGSVQLDLAALSAGDALPAALAQALRLTSDAAAATPEALAHSLRGLQLLLLLDNCEHLLQPVRALAQALLESAPGVRLLATSQEPLALGAEAVLRLPPLPVPPAGAGLDEAAASPAVALLVHRVRRSDPAFVLDAANVAAVTEICRRLDGVPLALELAAARVPLLGAAGVLRHLERPLQLLVAGAADAPPRQRTMRDALQWSHALLGTAEQVVFRRLGVFVGSFDADAAHVVAGESAAGGTSDPWDTIERLLQLGERSLLQVVADDSGRARYRLLESARAYALEQLAQAGETQAVQRRLALAMRDRFGAADATVAASPLLAWAEALRPDLGHLRAALTWALDPSGDPALAVALAGRSGSFFAGAGLDAEGARWLGAAQALLGPETPARDEAAIWLSIANLGTQPSIPAAAAYAAAERAVQMLRSLGDAPAQYRAMSLMVQHGQRVGAVLDVAAVIDEMERLEGPDWTVLMRRPRRWLVASRLTRAGQWEAARDRFRTEVALMQEGGDDWRAWNAAHNAALAEIMLGRPQAAAELMAPAAAAIVQRGLGRRCWSVLAMAAMCRIEAGDIEAAAPAVREAVRAMRVTGTLNWLDDHLAWWVALLGRPADAARLHGWAEAGHAGQGGQRSPQGQLARTRLLDWLAASLPAAQLEQLQAEGRRLSGDEVAVIVLRDDREGR